MRSFQGRLLSKLNHTSQKLIDNAIQWMGVPSDVIKITLKKDDVGDIISRTVESIDVVEVIFPNMVDVPMWRFVSANGEIQRRAEVINDPEDPAKKEPFICFAPMVSMITQDDLLIKFFENPASENPLVMVLQVKDVLGSFGGRSILFMKLKLSYYDENLPAFITDKVFEMSTRRETLKW